MRRNMMDSRTSIILMLAKYGGYTATLWMTINNWGFELDGPLVPLLLIFATDSIRNYVMADEDQHWARVIVWVQLPLTYLFLWVDGTGIGSILLVILIAESQMDYPRQLADRVFLMSLLGFLSVGFLRPWVYSQPVLGHLISVSINSLFFFFAYGVSLLARMQGEQTVRAERALGDLERSQEELEQAHRELMRNSQQRERMAALQERNRLAREIHDTVAHSLTGIVVGLEASRRLLEVDPGRAGDELTRIQDQARLGLQEIRRSVRAWRPEELDARGFESAVRGLARDMAERGLSVEFDLEDVSLPENLELALYRIIQEGMTNSLRHGNARKLEVRLRRKGSSTISLTLRDDGCGAGEPVEGYGLRGMRERLEEFNGTLEFSDVQPHGFILRAEAEVSEHGDPDPDR